MTISDELLRVGAALYVLVALSVLAIYLELGVYLRIITRKAGELYLRRWALRPHRPSGENGWRMYLHNFHAPDDDGHHNHPWRWSFSIVLRGSYTEEFFTDPAVVFRAATPERLAEVMTPDAMKATRRVRWFNWITADRYHRIVALHPAPGKVWTLFVCGPIACDADGKARGWGFWIPGRGHIPFAQRLAERTAAELEGAPTERSPMPAVNCRGGQG